MSWSTRMRMHRYTSLTPCGIDQVRPISSVQPSLSASAGAASTGLPSSPSSPSSPLPPPHAATTERIDIQDASAIRLIAAQYSDRVRVEKHELRLRPASRPVSIRHMPHEFLSPAWFDEV